MKLFYRKYGEGPAFIIVHGLYGSSDNWVSIGKALADRFEVYLVDQRNHGQSPHSDRHDYPSMKEDLREFMDDRAIESAVLAGHSMGGKTVMFFAVDYPERVNGLIVVDMSPRAYLSRENQSKGMIDHARIISAMRTIDPGRFTSREDIEQVFSSSIPVPRVSQFLLKNLRRNRNHSFSWKLNLEAIYRNIDRIMEGIEASKFDHGNGITGFPVLFIKGEKSNYITENDKPLIKKIFPYAEIVGIPNAGHWIHAEESDLLLKTVNEFILGV